MLVAERCRENMTNRRFGGQVGGHVQVPARPDWMMPWQLRHDALYHHGVDSSRHSEGHSGPGPSTFALAESSKGLRTAGASAQATPSKQLNMTNCSSGAQQSEGGPGRPGYGLGLTVISVS